MMNTKLIYTAIVACLIIAAMIIYRDVTLPEIISYFISAGGVLIAVWKWLEKDAVVAKKNREISQLRSDFFKAVGTDVDTFKRRPQ